MAHHHIFAGQLRTLRVPTSHSPGIYDRSHNIREMRTFLAGTINITDWLQTSVKYRKISYNEHKLYMPGFTNANFKLPKYMYFSFAKI